MLVLGGEAIWQSSSRLLKAGSLWPRFKGWLALPFNFSRPSSNYLSFLALGVLIPYFLFNTGFIFEVTSSELYNVVDTPSSTALSGYRTDMIASNYRENSVIKWLPGVVDKKIPVYGDRYGYLTLRFSVYGQSVPFPTDATLIPENAYIFLRTWNVNRNETVVLIRRGELIRFERVSFDDLPKLSKMINSKNIIYSSSGAQILGP
ncbi:DUF2206 domain-containing protein [Chloroflexota bacterium]